MGPGGVASTPGLRLLTAASPLQVYRGHGDLVRCLSVSPGGQWLVSGGPGGQPCAGRPSFGKQALSIFSALSRLRRRLSAALGGGHCPLPEDCACGGCGEECRLEPQPQHLPGGCGHVSVGPGGALWGLGGVLQGEHCAEGLPLTLPLGRTWYYC